jgi:hypothetical protein
MRTRFCVLTLGLVRLASAADVSHWLEVRGGAWTPTAAVLSEAEGALKAAVPSAASGRGPLPAWSTYTFQFQGMSSVTGRHYIRVNAFCDSPKNHSDISSHWVLVYDGGACFFSGKYDPSAKRVYDLQVNGVA